MDNQNLSQDKASAKKIEAGVENYVSTEGITTKQLEMGLWYIEHKHQLRMVLAGFLILISAISWVYVIYGFAYYIAKGMSEDEILAKELVQANSAGHDYVLQVAARDLAVSPAGVLKSTDKNYDLYAKIENSNARWWADFDYYFIASGRPTKKSAGYILPLETKYLAALAQDFPYAPSDARPVLENIRWHRVDRHKVADWNDYYNSHLNIESADIKFTPASLSELSEKTGLNQLSFNAINSTAYNYWDVGFTIIFYGGNSVVGINHYALSDFMSGEKRPVEISWPGNLGRVDKVEVIPEINIMKDDIYIKYEGGVGQPSGNN